MKLISMLHNVYTESNPQFQCRIAQPARGMNMGMKVVWTKLILDHGIVVTNATVIRLAEVRLVSNCDIIPTRV